jgi:HPt (histidine-containing phosphotransfer) domain-containing protein
MLLFQLLAKWLRRRGGIAVQAPVPGSVMQAGGARDAAVLDVAALSLTFSNDPVKMRKYAQLFLDTARDGLAEMEQALALEDLKRLADLGHRTKSSALAVGANAFAALCLALEGLRHGGELPQARALMAAMGPALARVAEQISLDFANSDTT